MISLPTEYPPFFYIVQLGSGGNGSYILQQVVQMMNIFNVAGCYTIADPDTVESKNLGNQLFIPKDVGFKKAEVLAKRYSGHYQIPIRSYTREFVQDETMLRQLFSYRDYLALGRRSFIPILISAVDNNFTRQMMHRYFESEDNLIYLDVGIEGAKVPQDGRSRENWTAQEEENYRKSGWVGQVVCGVRWKGETLLPPVAEVFPDVLEDDDPIAPSATACSEIVVSEPQRLLTNKFAALEVVSFFNEIFSENRISNHMSYITLQSKVKVRTIQASPDVTLQI
ncbi:ThiF family adenylyltransferase [Paenibacillus sp. FSL K6-3166]|uniref:ThiF family adenylyltransferase n=1 Tax=Paenibacillus sp. FSL K6-3166 TaxID=2921492 RepID=UPI0030FABE43